MTNLPDHDTPEAQLLEAFMHAIWDERHRAHDKHGATSMEQAPLLGHKRASVLTEEAVECARALNDHEHGEIVLRENLHEVGQRISGLPVRGIAQVGPIVDPLDKELIQTAAMAYTWWANRRGDQLAPPEQKPIRGGRTQTISVFIDGTPHIGVIDPVTGEVHVHTVVKPWGTAMHATKAGEEVTVKLSEAGVQAMVEVQIPPIPPVPVRKSSDLSFHEACFIRGPSEPSMATGPIGPPADDPDGGRRGD
jgi:hypothetical protein